MTEAIVEVIDASQDAVNREYLPGPLRERLRQAINNYNDYRESRERLNTLV